MRSVNGIRSDRDIVADDSAAISFFASFFHILFFAPGAFTCS